MPCSNKATNPFFGVTQGSSLGVSVQVYGNAAGSKVTAFGEQLVGSQWRPLWKNSDLIPGPARLPLSNPGSYMVRVGVNFQAKAERVVLVHAEIDKPNGKPDQMENEDVSGSGGCTSFVTITAVV